MAEAGAVDKELKGTVLTPEIEDAGETELGEASDTDEELRLLGTDCPIEVETGAPGIDELKVTVEMKMVDDT